MKKAPLILIFIIALNCGCNRINKLESKSIKEVEIGFFEETYNKKNYQYIMAFFATNYIEHREGGARTNQECADIIKGQKEYSLT